MSLPKAFFDLFERIGADASDPEQVRLLKRIWTVTIVVATPLSAGINAFIHQSSAISSFITFFYCELDRRGDEVCYVNAGHVPPLVLRTDGSLETLGSTGFCLGMFPGARYETKTALNLHPSGAVLPLRLS